MGEKTLLEQLKKEKEVEKQEDKPQEKEKEPPKEKKQEKTINIFSAASFPHKEMREEEERAINKIESKVSSVIETPNYDLTETLTEEEHKKVFVLEKEDPSPKKKTGKLKYVLMAILCAIFGVWGIINVAKIDNVASQMAEITTQYNINLFNYLKNLTMLDTANSENMKNLFETIPEEEVSPTNIGKKSNWFDRFCNFIGGLFGG